MAKVQVSRATLERVLRAVWAAGGTGSRRSTLERYSDLQIQAAIVLRYNGLNDEQREKLWKVLSLEEHAALTEISPQPSRQTIARLSSKARASIQESVSEPAAG